MPPEDELADEVPLRDENDTAEPEADAPPANPSDSGVDFAVAGEAPDDDPQYADYDGPTEDLSGMLADDAGQEASYGYDTAAETARFNDRAELSDLTDKAAVPDDSDQYKLSESDPGESSHTSFVEEAATTGSSEETAYEPPPAGDDDGGYSSHHPDLHSDVGAAPAYEEPATSDEMSGGYTAEEPAPEPEPEPVRPAAKQPSAPPRRAPAPEPVVDNSPKPGQVRKSAIDEMFARAAELKKKTR